MIRDSVQSSAGLLKVHIFRCFQKISLILCNSDIIFYYILYKVANVMRMEEDHVVKRVMTKAIPGKRKRGRPKTRWKDVCKRDMQTVGLREGDAGDRAYWKEMINNHSGDPR